MPQLTLFSASRKTRPFAPTDAGGFGCTRPSPCDENLDPYTGLPWEASWVPSWQTARKSWGDRCPSCLDWILDLLDSPNFTWFGLPRSRKQFWTPGPFFRRACRWKSCTSAPCTLHSGPRETTGIWCPLAQEEDCHPWRRGFLVSDSELRRNSVNF